MSLPTGFNFFVFYMSVMCCSFVILPLVTLMHFLMRNAVLERYWKESHSVPDELTAFTDTIYAPMRTVMMMWLIAFP